MWGRELTFTSLLSLGHAVPAKIVTMLGRPPRAGSTGPRLLDATMLDLGPYLRRPASTLASIASDPLEAWIRFSEQFSASREAPTPPNLYAPDPEWQSQLLRGLDSSAADRMNGEFWALWSKVVDELAAKGIRTGPASFKGWNDGDAGFVRAIWILTCRLKPRTVVETGVAHGVTSRFILEALEQIGSGQLLSIDRAPIEREWQNQIGVAVDARLRGRWTYVSGSSRRRLPELISRLGVIDIFVHDSLHSERNVRFEMDRAFAVLRPGGAIVVDDIDITSWISGASRSRFLGIARLSARPSRCALTSDATTRRVCLESYSGGRPPTLEPGWHGGASLEANLAGFDGGPFVSRVEFTGAVTATLAQPQRRSRVASRPLPGATAHRDRRGFPLS